jgi:hypothetical protein
LRKQQKTKKTKSILMALVYTMAFPSISSALQGLQKPPRTTGRGTTSSIEFFHFFFNFFASLEVLERKSWTAEKETAMSEDEAKTQRFLKHIEGILKTVKNTKEDIKKATSTCLSHLPGLDGVFHLIADFISQVWSREKKKKKERKKGKKEEKKGTNDLTGALVGEDE